MASKNNLLSLNTRSPERSAANREEILLAANANDARITDQRFAYARVALLICSPKYLSGGMTLGEVIQTAAAFVIVQGAFRWFTDSYGRLAE